MNRVCHSFGRLIVVDTKKGVLVRLENLSVSDISEEKDSDAKATELPNQPEEVAAEPIPESTPQPEESAPKEAIEGDSKEEEATTEITEDKECIPDDKKETVPVEEKPTQLTTLATAPRDNIVWYAFHFHWSSVRSGILATWKREHCHTN